MFPSARFPSLRATHAAKLERWLGGEQVKRIATAMQDFYWPVPLGQTPGSVVAYKGDFFGDLDIRPPSKRKTFGSLFSWMALSPFGAGFASLSDLISEASTGKRREYLFQKAGPTGATGVTSSLWGLGNTPVAGINASNAPGGDAPTSATAGAFPFTNPSGSDTQHIVSAFPLSSVAGNTLMLYDRLFQVNKTMNSTATEAVTGVPSRYQSTTASDMDYVGGNFLFTEVGSVAVAATGHNWTVCTYTDQGGAASTLPAFQGVSGAIVRRLDMANWFAPLESGDVGIKTLTQMQCSALVATGTVNFVIGHPIAVMPCPIANLVCVSDYINTAFNLARIFNDAALAFLELNKPSSTATTYNGSFTTVAG